MRGEKVRMWLTDFKIALATKDTEKLDSLLSVMPQFSDLNEMEEAAYLLKEAFELLQNLQNETKNSMLQLKKNINFLKSTHSDEAPKLNIKL